jgi:hypothetical protein
MGKIIIGGFMKTFKLLFLLFLITCLISCSEDDESNPLSFVDGYSVSLTEPEGTTYSGDFFPLQEGHTLNYSGAVDMITELSIPGEEPSKESTVAPALGMLKVLALQNIPLQSGTIPLYPIVDLSEIQGEITADTSRYFDKDEEAVYVKAIKMSDGSYLEVENPVYIKSSLVVGESWETAPQMDMTQLFSSEFGETSDMSLDAESKFFVVGHEMIFLPVGEKWAMRMEQANDITMKGTLYIYGSAIKLTVTSKLATVYHLLADTGVVHQNTTGSLNMKMSFEGETISIKMTINQSELNLTNVGGDGFMNTKVVIPIDQSIEIPQLTSIDKRNNQKVKKIVQSLSSFLIHNLKL